MMNTILLVAAIMLTFVLFLPLLLIHTIRRGKTLGKYYLNLAVNIDYVWGALLFGTDGHTVSAICYKRRMTYTRYRKYVRLINWLFDDNTHCKTSYEYEFITRPQLTLKVHDV